MKKKKKTRQNSIVKLVEHEHAKHPVSLDVSFGEMLFCVFVYFNYKCTCRYYRVRFHSIILVGGFYFDFIWFLLIFFFFLTRRRRNDRFFCLFGFVFFFFSIVSFRWKLKRDRGTKITQTQSLLHKSVLTKWTFFFFLQFEIRFNVFFHMRTLSKSCSMTIAFKGFL